MGFHDYTAILGSRDLVVLFVMPICGTLARAAHSLTQTPEKTAAVSGLLLEMEWEPFAGLEGYHQSPAISRAENRLDSSSARWPTVLSETCRAAESF